MTGRYAVEFDSAARKELRRLDPVVRARVMKKITALADDPRPPGAIRLAGGHDLWRIRIGGYRVVYAIEDGRLIITVVRVAGRGKVYRDI